MAYSWLLLYVTCSSSKPSTSNCATSGSALLGPILTGAKTGSIYQTSLSFGSNKIIGKLREDKNNEKQIKISNNNNLPDIPYIDKDPTILLAYAVDHVELSEVFEPEPLP